LFRWLNKEAWYGRAYIAHKGNKKYIQKKWSLVRPRLWRKAAPYLKRLVAGFPPLRSGVRDRVSHVGFCGWQNGAGVGFIRVLRFPLPIFIQPIAPKIILIYHRGLYNRPKWPQYPGLIDT
jgi:hypothetical protein